MALRLCGILLLVLVVSPVTAPFSTCDLTALLGGQPHGGAILQPKAAPDEPVPGLCVSPVLQILQDESTPASMRRVSDRQGTAEHHTQLRV